MFIEMILVSVVSLLILNFRKGSLDISKFQIEIKGYKVLILMAAIEITAILLFRQFSDVNLLRVLSMFWIIYFPILIISLLNINKHCMRLFFIGTLLNLTAIVFNDFKMPVYIAQAAANGQTTIAYLSSGSDLIHSLLNDTTRFKFLCDIITLPPPYPFVKTISLGDIFLLSGIFIFWQESYKSIDTQFIGN